MELKKRPYYTIHNIASIIISLISFIYLYKYNSPTMIQEAIIWAIIIGVSFLFVFDIKGLELTIGGVLCTCIVFLFKWYYMPLIFILSYALYITLLAITKGTKYVKDEEYTLSRVIFGIGDYILIEIICNQIFLFFVPSGNLVLNKDILSVLIIVILESLLCIISIMIDLKERDYISSIIESIIDNIRELYAIYLISIPFAILISVMYKDYGFLGFALAGSFAFVLQVAFSKQARVIEIEEESYTDVLTGVKNKKYYIEQIPENLDSSCAIFFIDFNGFKQVNDTYGHDVGDSVIIHGANILKNALRERDEIIRFGGDEFMLLIKEADREICKNVALRIANLCDEMIFKEDDIELKIGMAIGIGICPEESDVKETLSAIADTKMYEAKQDKTTKNVVFKI